MEPLRKASQLGNPNLKLALDRYRHFLQAHGEPQIQVGENDQLASFDKAQWFEFMGDRLVIDLQHETEKLCQIVEWSLQTNAPLEVRELLDGLLRMLDPIPKIKVPTPQPRLCNPNVRANVDAKVLATLDKAIKRLANSVPPIVLNGPLNPPVIYGKPKPVTAAEYNVLKALLDAGSAGLAKDLLASNSGHEGAVNILKRLAKKGDGWDRLIALPKTKNRGYRLNSI